MRVSFLLLSAVFATVDARRFAAPQQAQQQQPPVRLNQWGYPMGWGMIPIEEEPLEYLQPVNRGTFLAIGHDSIPFFSRRTDRELANGLE
jgi:hypothetical protein